VSRLPRLVPGDLDHAQSGLYASIAGGARAQGPQHFALTNDDGSLTGPFNAMLHAPALGAALQHLGAAVRYETALSARVREMAILVVAAHWNSAFERHAHEAVGLAAGLTEGELGDIRSGRVPVLDDAAERSSIDLVRALVGGDVDDEQWRSATAELSPRAIVELTTLVGYYATLALQLRVFRVDSPIEG
jgi:4-carboxymuconolactone decarboxylase